MSEEIWGFQSGIKFHMRTQISDKGTGTSFWESAKELSNMATLIQA